ncbi:MAG TPA: molybdopterin oxidoreductase family protein [Thermoleophilaceae bacterium]
MAYTTCPLCEATCGLELELADDGSVARIRGDKDDVFSKGFICPKGGSMTALHEDPDRVRTPLVRRDGELVEATWDEAFEEINRRLPPILERHGRNAVGVYLGNPSVHNLSFTLYGRVLLKALGTRNIFSASTVDQMPKQVSAGLMFGTFLSIPIPDIDRTDYMLMLGANPLASNGSLMTAPDYRGRMRAVRDRGGKIVVIDPRRSRTAENADEHHFIRPGGDAFFLAALAREIFETGLADVGEVAEHVEGVERVRELVAPFDAERAAAACGIPADDIRRIARELATAERACVYGRIGTCTQEFGTLASWLVDVLNTITGNLDRPGGVMFPKAAVGQPNTVGEPGRGRGVKLGRWASRVRELPETFGELPVAALSEEIETPGEGQIRALITVAGNPALSTPNSERLANALDELDFMVSLDVYVNETTRHADVILPSPGPFEHSHYDIAFYQLAVRNIANYTPALMEPPAGMPDDWENVLRLTGIVTGQGPDADIDAIDAFVAGEVARRAGIDPEQHADAMARRGPERLLDLQLRAGPYDLTLADLEAAPHGIDLGALEPRIPEMLRTATGKVELAPDPIAGDVPRLEEALERSTGGGMVLIGRRQLRSNNSWMHNIQPLVKGKERCTAHVHPDDAARLGLRDGEPARVSSRAGAIEVPVEVTDAVMPGVVSIPHGWGHDADGVRMSVASAHAGTNSNVLADEELIDPLSGNAVLNGIPVELAPVEAAVPA